MFEHNLIFSSPTYGMAYPAAVNSHMAAIMHAARHGAKWYGVASPDRVDIVAARNTVANIAREGGYGVVWADADTEIEAAGIAQLLRHGEDFVSAIGFQRNPPHFAMIGKFLIRKGKVKSQWIAQWPEEDGLRYPMETTGFSLVYTSNKMLRQLPKDPFDKTEGLSEDLSFCWRAKKAGIQLWVDTAINTYHLGDYARVGKAFAKEHWAKENVFGDEAAA